MNQIETLMRQMEAKINSLQESIAAKDTEIAELKAQLEGLKTDMQHSRLIEAVQVKEAATKDAEIKRLREGVENLRQWAARWAIQYGKDGVAYKTFSDELQSLLSPAPVAEDKFSVSAYPKECVPTIEQLTENDGMSMMERLEKRMPPFHKVAPVTDGKDKNGLLPCPFCAEAKYIECEHMYGNPLYKFIVTCKHCGATSCDSETKDEAIAAWNKRA